MPNPKEYKTEKEFMTACVPMVTDDKTAKDNKQAVAICFSMWRNRHKKMAKGNTLDSTLPESLQIASLGLTSTESVDGITERSKSSSDRRAEDNHGRRLAGAVGDHSSTFSSEQVKQRGDKAMADTSDLRKEVETILAEKDAAKRVETRIADLETQKETLASAKSQAETENAKLSTQLTSAQADAAKQAEQLKTLAKEKEELAAKVASLNGELTKIREEQALAARTVELTAAGLLLPVGEKRDKQLQKVRAMNDADYTVYKQELADFAETVKANAGNTPDAAKAAAEKAEAEKIVAAKAEADKKAADEQAAIDKAKASEDGVQPPDLSHGEMYRQAVAAISAGVVVDDTMVGTYAKM